MKSERADGSCWRRRGGDGADDGLDGSRLYLVNCVAIAETQLANKVGQVGAVRMCDESVKCESMVESQERVSRVECDHLEAKSEFECSAAIG